MIFEVRNLVDEYHSWLKDKTAIRPVDGWVEITAPYLDRHNDRIQLYARVAGDSVTLTDDGETLRDLASSGCDLATSKRRALLNLTLRGFGVQIEDEALVVRGTRSSFAAKKHALIQAILAVNDMFFLAQANVASLFHEDVASWLEANNIRAVQRVKLSGKSGFDHLFDFLIPASREAPERLIQVASRPSRDKAQAMAFSWIDTQETRPHGARAIAILNDTEKPLTEAVVTALKSYNVRPVPWSKRTDYLPDLAA